MNPNIRHLIDNYILNEPEYDEEIDESEIDYQLDLMFEEARDMELMKEAEEKQ